MSYYPPQPWDLHGHAYIGLWLLDRRAAPAPHCAETTTVTLFGRAVLCAAFFSYREPSPLSYDEVMATVLVRTGWRLRLSITHIWVNSPASRAGGRELWAIPKELAAFENVPHSSYAAQRIASLAVQRVRRLPWRWPVAFRIAQDRAGHVLVSPVRGSMRFGIVRGHWSFASSGPLAFLAGRKPVATFATHPFRLLFGRR